MALLFRPMTVSDHALKGTIVLTHVEVETRTPEDLYVGDADIYKPVLLHKKHPEELYQPTVLLHKKTPEDLYVPDADLYKPALLHKKEPEELYGPNEDLYKPVLLHKKEVDAKA
jgi:hypothetical protein